MKTEHAIDWNKTAKEIEEDYESLAMQLESLRQQFSQCEEGCFIKDEQIETLEQQLADSQVREVMLRDALSNLRWAASERDKKNRIRQFDEFMDRAEEALAATEADLGGLIVCEKEPVGYMFQHEDTGRTMCVEAQQVEWNFEKNNPRLFKCGELYAKPKGLK